MGGHVFVTRGDLTRLACDAWLLPGSTDAGPESPGVGAKWLPRGGSLERRFKGKLLRDPQRAPGTTRVWTLPRIDQGEPHVHLVDTGGTRRSELSWYMEALDEFLAAVRDNRPDASATGRERPLVAVPLIGTGDGGADTRRGSIVEALLGQLYRAAADTDFAADYALVAFREEDYAAAQSVRRACDEHVAWPSLADTPALVEVAKELAGHALEGQLVLFLGAGVSAGAGLPLWDELLRKLATRAEIPEQQIRRMLKHLDPLDSAAIIQRRLAERGTEVGSAVRDELRATRHSISHLLLAVMPVREVATTNYDELFEDASEAVGRKAAVLPYAPDRSRKRWVLKLHGTLGHPDEIVLTRDDYLAYGEQRAALAGLVQGLLITKHMLFVGFSLADDNFHRIVHDVRKAIRPRDEGHVRERFGTAISLDDDDLRRELWTDDLALLSTAVDGEDDPNRRTAARRLEIFLDRLLFETAQASSHLMNPAYAEILSPEERELADLFKRFLADARGLGQAASAPLARIDSLAREFGAGPAQRKERQSPAKRTDERGLARAVTSAFWSGQLTIHRPGAPTPGWEGMPEVRAAHTVTGAGGTPAALRRVLTFTAALDRARDADLLWNASAKLFAEHPWVFDPAVVLTRRREAIELLRSYRVSQRHRPDSDAWLAIAASLMADGRVRHAIENGHGDAQQLISAVRERRGAYPMLGGPKIGPMWVRMLAEPGGARIDGLDSLPVAVDVQVKRASEYLGVVDTGSMEVSEAKPVIQAAWERDVREHGCAGPATLENTCSALDPALWFWGKWGCSACEAAQEKRPIAGACSVCRFPLRG